MKIAVNYIHKNSLFLIYKCLVSCSVHVYKCNIKVIDLNNASLRFCYRNCVKPGVGDLQPVSAGEHPLP